MFWHGTPRDHSFANLGTLALTAPAIQKLDLAAIVDHFVPPDPQREFSHGQVLATLLAARLDRPTALVNVADWARESGAELLFGVPPDKLNDDRLGRALDAFFDARHSILAATTAQAIGWTKTERTSIHFDPTDITFHGEYKASQPRPAFDGPTPFDAAMLPAHLQRGYDKGLVCVQLGAAAVVDEFGALPVFAHCYDGNRNGFTGVRETADLMQQFQIARPGTLLVSDRGTFSAGHLANLAEHRQYAACAANWGDYRKLYDEHAKSLHWQDASYLSLEQQLRRERDSSLPLDRYQIACIDKHTLIDRDTKREVEVRVIFVRSSCGERTERECRANASVKIQAGLAAFAAKLERGHPASTKESIERQIAKLMGKRDAAKFFRWEMVRLTESELAALPKPKKGHRLPTHRLEWTFDAEAAAQSQAYDGLSAIVTTAPWSEYSIDRVFSTYKAQAYLERTHHVLKTPLQVSPVFLKTPKRVEALVMLVYLALAVEQSIERAYRKAMTELLENAGKANNKTSALKIDRTTTKTLFRAFRQCHVTLERGPAGIVVRTTIPSEKQRQILSALKFPTLDQQLAMRLPTLSP
jgi:transposase